MAMGSDGEESSARSKEPFWHGITNLKWLSWKVLLILKNGGMGTIFPYYVVYYRARSLSPSQIGLIECICPFVGAISRPIVAGIADKKNKHTMALGVCILFNAFFTLSLIFIAATPSSSTTHLENITCSKNDSNCDYFCNDYYDKVNVDNGTNCTVNCVCTPAFNETTTIAESHPDTAISYFSENKTFLVIIVLRLASFAFLTPTFSLEDSIICDTLGQRHRHFWGQQRMFGTLSLGLFAICTGIIIDNSKMFNVAFYAFGLLNVGAIITAFVWVPQPPNDPHDAHEHFRWIMLKSLCQLPLFLVACAVAFVSGMLVSIVLVILPQWALHLGAPHTLLGASTITSCCIESLGLFIAGHVIVKLGEVVCFLVMFFAYSVRFVAYSFLTTETVWLILLAELTQLFCFAFFVTALTQFAASIAPRGMSATVQSIFQTCFIGFGLGIGNLVAGALLETFGGALTFRIFAVVSFLCFLILLTLHLLWLRKKLRAQKKSSDKTRSNISEKDASLAIPLQRYEDKTSNNDDEHGESL